MASLVESERVNSVLHILVYVYSVAKSLVKYGRITENYGESCLRGRMKNEQSGSILSRTNFFFFCTSDGD